MAGYAKPTVNIAGVVLGKRAFEVYCAIAEFWRRHGHAPSLDKISLGIPFGPRGKPVNRYAVKFQVDRLKRAGLIDYEPKEIRTIRIKRAWPGYETEEIEHVPILEQEVRGAEARPVGDPRPVQPPRPVKGQGF